MNLFKFRLFPFSSTEVEAHPTFIYLAHTAQLDRIPPHKRLTDIQRRNIPEPSILVAPRSTAHSVSSPPTLLISWRIAAALAEAKLRADRVSERTISVRFAACVHSSSSLTAAHGISLAPALCISRLVAFTLAETKFRADRV